MNRLEVLNQSEIEKIHHTALENLSDLGLWINDEKVSEILGENGCKVNRDKKIVKFPKKLVEECIKRTPSSFKMGARLKENIIDIGNGEVNTRPMSGCHLILDLDNGECREGLASDVAKCSLLVNNLKNISYNGAVIYPSDELPVIRDVHLTKVMLENSLKHIQCQPFEAKNLKYMIELCIAVMGSKEKMMEYPLITLNVAPTSPLKYSENEVKILELASLYKIPVMLGSTPISGATGPITLAGQLVLIHTETLAGLTLQQVINPGTPILYGPRPNTMDMRTGNALWGSIEFGITSAAVVQLAHYLNIPTDIMGAGTDSKVLDEQTGIEKSMNLLIAAVSGSDVVSGLGFIETINTASYEQLVIDNEVAGMMYRVLEGIDINNEKLAVDVIREVGFNGNYLTHEKTRKFMRKEHYIPEILNRQTRDDWKLGGSKDLAKIANDKAKDILKNAEIPHLDEDVKKEFEKIYKSAKKDILKES